MARKRNPSRGELYQIYSAPFKQHYRKSERLVWEGYGESDPWGVFDILKDTYSNDVVTLYVVKRNMLFELAQYEQGQITFASED